MFITSQKFNLSDLDMYNIGQYYMYTLKNKIAWGRISLRIGKILQTMNAHSYMDIYKKVIIEDKEHVAELLTLFNNLTNTSHKDVHTEKKVFFVVTKRCNLNCRMCYINANYNNLPELNGKQIKNSFQTLINHGYNNITISGGEPFIREDILEILSMANQFFNTISVNTNGTLLCKEYQDFIMENQIHIMISLEGINERCNDLMRGEGSYKKAKSVIDCFLKHHYKNFSVSVTMTKCNYQYVPDLIDFCIKNDVNLNLGTFIEGGRGKINNFKYKLQSSEQLNTYVKILETELNSQNKKKSKSSNILSKCSGNCGAIKNQINVMENGDVYPCQNLIDARWKMGNILEDELDTILSYDQVNKELKNRNVNQVNECKNCPFKYICSGGCMANSYLTSGSVYSCDPMCKFYKALYSAYLNSWEYEETEENNVRRVVAYCKKHYIKN